EAAAALLDGLAGGLAFLGVEPAVAVLVEVLDDLAGLASGGAAEEEVLLAFLFLAGLRRQEGGGQEGEEDELPGEPAAMDHRVPRYGDGRPRRPSFIESSYQIRTDTAARFRREFFGGANTNHENTRGESAKNATRGAAHEVSGLNNRLLRA